MILYEDKEILVCHKPEGIAVQSARLGQKDMVSILNNELIGRGEGMIYVVHRLDQPVEGVLVFAKNQRAASQLTRQITNGSMEKVYHAVCQVMEQGCRKYLLPEGSENAEGIQNAEICRETYELRDYLVKDARTNTSSVAGKGEKNAKEARLSFRILKEHTERKCVLAEIHLDTGRHHQIRVQMAHAGLPLYGDRKYNPEWTAAGGTSELALCAVSLTFAHPVTGKKMRFEVRPEKEVFRMFE